MISRPVSWFVTVGAYVANGLIFYDVPTELFAASEEDAVEVATCA
jgi:hypothetical protein